MTKWGSKLMQLYLLRHGIAHDESPTGKDSDRELTDEGRQKLRHTLGVVAAADVRPDVIVTSPYVRARQTAEIAKQSLGFEPSLNFADALVPDSDPEDVWREVRNLYRGSESIVLVSHEPLMGRCVGFLLNAPELLVDFKKGAVVRIDIEQIGVRPRGILRWMIVPKLAGA